MRCEKTLSTRKKKTNKNLFIHSTIGLIGLGNVELEYVQVVAADALRLLRPEVGGVDVFLDV